MEKKIFENNVLSLPSVDCGGIQLRYLIINNDHHVMIDRLTLDDLPDALQPVFLAADILRLMMQSSSGLTTRFLNRLESLKLLTRMKCPGVNVEGINNSASLNFVSVQAVFMALFSGNQTSTQLPVVSRLSEVWKRHCSHTLPGETMFRPQAMKADNTPQSSASHKLTEPVDELLQKLDTLHCEAVAYIQDIRSLLNSYRSAITKYGTDNFSHLIRHHEAQMQDLIAGEGNSQMPDTDFDNQLLEQASRRLGRDFARLNSLVQHKVHKFKSENIRCIDSLPSAKDTCESIFPPAMIKLFEEWLSVTHAEHMASATSGKRLRSAVDSSYPFIQHVLELCNNSLISGAAHVIYSRLLIDQGSQHAVT